MNHTADVARHHLLLSNMQHTLPRSARCSLTDGQLGLICSVSSLASWWTPRVWFLTETQHGQTNRLQWNQPWRREKKKKKKVYKRVGSWWRFVRQASLIMPGRTEESVSKRLDQVGGVVISLWVVTEVFLRSHDLTERRAGSPSGCDS